MSNKYMKFIAPRLNEMDNEIRWLLTVVLKWFFKLCFCFHNSLEVNKTHYHHLWVHSRKIRSCYFFLRHCYIEMVATLLKQGAYLFPWCPGICVISVWIWIFSPQKNREWCFKIPLQPRASSTFFYIWIPLNILKIQLVPGVVPVTAYF